MANDKGIECNSSHPIGCVCVCVSGCARGGGEIYSHLRDYVSIDESPITTTHTPARRT